MNFFFQKSRSSPEKWRFACHLTLEPRQQSIPGGEYIRVIHFPSLRGARKMSKCNLNAMVSSKTCRPFLVWEHDRFYLTAVTARAQEWWWLLVLWSGKPPYALKIFGSGRDGWDLFMYLCIWGSVHEPVKTNPQGAALGQLGGQTQNPDWPCCRPKGREKKKVKYFPTPSFM